MLSKWPIRVKFLAGLGLLLLLVTILSSSGIYAGNAYRSLVKNVSWRADEWPLAAELSRKVSDLRSTLSNLKTLNAVKFPDSTSMRVEIRVLGVRDQFRTQLDDVEETLSQYEQLLSERVLLTGSPIADTRSEWRTVDEIKKALERVHLADNDQDWMFDDVKVVPLDAALNDLQDLSAELPSHLVEKLQKLAPEARSQYHTLIYGTWATAITAGLIFALFVRLFYRWIFRPLRILIDGSRRVAAGQFDYRIHLNTDDEMAELADAMNDMTRRFRVIRDDLDRQVQERTRQVVRSEQLASVGFLAAGVAHEINNPLASIALCAESLDGRLVEILDDEDEQHAVVAKYLKMIQTEAFRCKEITEKLLDFSRVGQAERRDAELGELVAGVIDMLGHLGKYQGKRIEFESAGPVIAAVNSQEIKQIVLNLLTNALDSIDDEGTVTVRLRCRQGLAELDFADDGQGMTPEVLKHVFEPFYTRRRSGQGTGLGLSITYRIIADHDGDIEAYSEGPGHGATFCVRLPLTTKAKESENQYRAA